MMEPMDPASQPGSGVGPGGVEGSKLPPVLANLMGNLGANNLLSNLGNIAQGTPGAPANPSVNVQELLTSIMVSDIA